MNVLRTPILLLLGALAFNATGGSQAASTSTSPAPPFSSNVERCIIPAANYHRVNPHVLRAILVVESSLRPDRIGVNRNGSIDVGMAQINSIHFPALAKYGIAPVHLMDPCVATYVAAWQLRRAMAQGGNTWAAIANYHSANPYFNHRYQILLQNELVRSKVIAGQIVPVPPLQPSVARLAAPRRSADQQAVVFDQQN